MRFPSTAYAPTTGDWNWVVAWHVDVHTESYGAYSTALGVYTDYPTVSGQVGVNPRFVLRLAGGNSASPTYNGTSCALPSNSLKYDHWYRLVFHLVWSADSSVGLVQWWVDGAQICSLHFPTLFRNPDGTTSTNAFGLYNYHYAAPWNSRVDVDDVAIGPSLSSVGG